MVEEGNSATFEDVFEKKLEDKFLEKEKKDKNNHLNQFKDIVKLYLEKIEFEGKVKERLKEYDSKRAKDYYPGKNSGIARVKINKILKVMLHMLDMLEMMSLENLKDWITTKC